MSNLLKFSTNVMPYMVFQTLFMTFSCKATLYVENVEIVSEFDD